MSGPQQRPGNSTPTPGFSGLGTALPQPQYMQQALQQNPQLASRVHHHLQAGNPQTAQGSNPQAHQQPGAASLTPQQQQHAAQYLQSQQQLIRQQHQQHQQNQQQQQQPQRHLLSSNANPGTALQPGVLQMRPPAKQPVAMPRPAAGFSVGAAASGALRQPSPAPTAGTTAGAASSVASNTFAMSTAEMVPAAKKKKRPLSDSRLPEKVAAYVPESALYTQLQEYERRTDACLLQRQAQLQDAARRPLHVAKKLRLYIYNTHSGQDPDSSSSDPASWALIIQGKLIETPIASLSSQASPQVYHPPSHPFTHYIRRLKVDLDSDQFENGEEQVVWEKGQHGRNHRDSFEIRRRGREDVEVSIQVEVDSQPPTFTLSAPLAHLLGLRQASRAAVVQTLWAYIKAHRLQSSEQASILECDAKLAAVLGVKSLKMSSLNERLNEHLQPVEPLTVTYTIRTSGSSPTQPESYDIAIEVPASSLDQATAPLLQHLNTSRDIEQLDQQIMTAVRKVHEHKRRRAFYLGFSQSPVDFINALVASQERDLKVMRTEHATEYEAMLRPDIYKGKWAEDAVLRHLHKRTAAGA